MFLLLGIHLKVTCLQENKGHLKRGVLSQDNPCTIAFKTLLSINIFVYQVILREEKNPFKLWYYTTHTCLATPQPNATLEVEKMPFLNVICLNCICSFPVSTTPFSESIFLCGNLLSTLTFKKWIFCFLAEFNSKIGGAAKILWIVALFSCHLATVARCHVTWHWGDAFTFELNPATQCTHIPLRDDTWCHKQAICVKTKKHVVVYVYISWKKKSLVNWAKFKQRIK